MKQRIGAVIDWFIVVSTVFAVGAFFMGAKDSLGSDGATCLRYFTTDSNVLAALAAGLYLAFGNKRKPLWLRLLRFAATVAVLVTALTVVFFLAPSDAVKKGAGAFFDSYAGNMFALHLTTPVLMLVTALRCYPERFTKKAALWGTVPVAVYEAVYAPMVVLWKKWPDFYGFTFGGNERIVPVSALVMLAFAAGLSLLVRFFMARAADKKESE